MSRCGRHLGSGAGIALALVLGDVSRAAAGSHAAPAQRHWRLASRVVAEVPDSIGAFVLPESLVPVIADLPALVDESEVDISTTYFRFDNPFRTTVGEPATPLPVTFTLERVYFGNRPQVSPRLRRLWIPDKPLPARLGMGAGVLVLGPGVLGATAHAVSEAPDHRLAGYIRWRITALRPDGVETSVTGDAVVIPGNRPLDRDWVLAMANRRALTLGLGRLATSLGAGSPRPSIAHNEFIALADGFDKPPRRSQRDGSIEWVRRH